MPFTFSKSTFRAAISSSSILTCAIALSLTASANAGLTTTVALGASGWQASWDAALNPVLDINVDGVTSDAVFIEKTAQFLPGVASIDITFTQISPDAVSNIVINDEIITNSSGAAWNDFSMSVLGAANVAFDPTASAAFDISPFTSASFTNSDQTFSVAGGTVANNSFWFPGQSSGELWIHVQLTAASMTTFVLSERPAPAPGAMGLLGLAGIAFGRRRRHS